MDFHYVDLKSLMPFLPTCFFKKWSTLTSSVLQIDRSLNIPCYWNFARLGGLNLFRIYLIDK